ncbi:unnamed protein product [Trichogramma brassicae]|uniref:Uncharacterized protein n=1 Tax=Trichogramma brassicae TaxID=86971 RepID=A0A6H5IPX5_9HYME|nr:unnamed protein product [Trichogramma brassicae]
MSQGDVDRPTRRGTTTSSPGVSVTSGRVIEPVKLSRVPRVENLYASTSSKSISMIVTYHLLQYMFREISLLSCT